MRREQCCRLTLRYVETLACIVENIADSPEVEHRPAAAESDAPSGNGCYGEESGGPEKATGKRKQDDFDTQLDLSREDGVEVAVASTSTKRLRPSLRIRCLFRAKKSRRFNVRDHQGCAMTYYFTSMADLKRVNLPTSSRSAERILTSRRQHIRKRKKFTSAR
jgi:hypothetical protein